MEVVDSGDSAVHAPEPSSDLPVANGGDTAFLDHTLADDDRSSSLSDLDDRIDTEQLDDDDEPPLTVKAANEVDSEAETERIEDSPHRVRDHASIILSAAGTYETSPSKLAQSTTYDELVEEEDDNERSPSKPPRSTKNNGVTADTDDISANDTSLDSLNKKRKRPYLDEDTGTEPADDEPVRKRRGSLVSEGARASLEPPMSPSVAGASLKHGEVSNTGTPVPEDQDEETPAPHLKGRKGKKGKRKGKKVKGIGEDSERQSVSLAEADGNGTHHAEEDEIAAEAEEADDAETITKMEEEYNKKSSALEVLSSLERQFAALRDKIYDERIANLNNELSQLEDANPTHPEFLRQLDILANYREDKVSHAERSQVNSTYFQRTRDVREKHLSHISALHYRIQQDRFQNVEASPDYTVPFPMRRSQQIAQQSAYNKEVSILSGVAKYVGFPAAPAMQPARSHECDEDFEKMGIPIRPSHTNHGPTSFPQQSFSRNAFASTPSASGRLGAGDDDYTGDGTRIDHGYSGSQVGRAMS